MRMATRLAGEWLLILCLLATSAGPAVVGAAEDVDPAVETVRPLPSRDVLQPREWTRLERSIDRGLAWLATQQRQDGSFLALDTGQPAVTALCTLAFLSRGHTPGEGPYGSLIDRGIEFTLTCQHPEGLIARHYPRMPLKEHNPTHTAAYNHAIAGLMLSEAYGMTRGERNHRMRAAIESAIAYTQKRQFGVEKAEVDKGGWRYINSPTKGDADLSITSWQLMFLRSAVNAGFEIPVRHVDQGVVYVSRCYDPERRCFKYCADEERISRAMAGAGALSLSLAGQHHTPMARETGRWILAHPFTHYGNVVGGNDAFLYSAFYCSQAMFQLGGDYWSGFYPKLVSMLLDSQRQDGSWPTEVGRGNVFGRAYSTALAVLALNVPNQLLPIFQR